MASGTYQRVTESSLSRVDLEYCLSSLAAGIPVAYLSLSHPLSMGQGVGLGTYDIL